MYYYIFSILSIHKCSIHNAYSQGLYTRSFCVVLCWIGLDWIGVSLIVCGLFFPFCLFAVSTFCHFCYLAIFPSCSLSRAFSFCFVFLDRLQVIGYRVYVTGSCLGFTRLTRPGRLASTAMHPLAYQILQLTRYSSYLLFKYQKKPVELIYLFFCQDIAMLY